MSNTHRFPRLTDSREAAQHYRLVISSRDLGQPTVLVICCDGEGRPIEHLHLVDCDLDTTPSECADLLDALLERLRVHEPSAYTGLSLGLTRPGGQQIQAYDRAWFRGFHRVCHRRAMTPQGVYVVSRGGARVVHIDDAA